MTRARRLSEAEFNACFAHPMRDVMGHEDTAIDIWPYVDALELDDLDSPSLDEVHHVYRDAHGRYDQVLIGTGRLNVFLVIVVDLQAQSIFGHTLLDLNAEYGVR